MQSSSDEGQSEAPAAPAGWRTITALPGGDSLPRVIASIPAGLDRTAEQGIDSQIASFEGRSLFVRFAYGAAAHPGCTPGADACRLGTIKIAGAEAKSSVSAAPSGRDGATTVHDYFVPPVSERAVSNDSSEGGGLLVTVKCPEQPTCPAADQIASTIRFTDAEGPQ